MVDVTGSNVLYTSYLVDSFKGGVFEPENHSLRMGLLRSTYTPDAGHSELSDVVADELSGNGYGRQTLMNVAVASDGTWVTLSFDRASFQASGGNLQAMYWFLFDTTPGNDPLIAYGKLDGSRDDEIILVDGFGVDVQVNELGLFRLPA